MVKCKILTPALHMIKNDRITVIAEVHSKDERTNGGVVFEPFMGPKSQVELTPPRPGQLGR